MRIGVPREIKPGETRVGLLPEAIAALVGRGHSVTVQTQAGGELGIADDAFRAAGAVIAETAASVFGCDLIVKVKELQPPEWPLLRMSSIIAAFHQLSSDAARLDAVLQARVTCLAYETLEDEDGALPVLAPMSRIAGALAPQLAARALWRGLDASSASGLRGAGILLTSLGDVAKRRALVLGAGSVGLAATRTLLGMGVAVEVLSRTSARRTHFLAQCAYPVRFELVSADAVTTAVRGVDVVIGAVLERGRLSPKLLTRAHLRSMTPGGVLIDVGIDQGGVAVTSRPSTLAEPFYVEEGIVHCCIANLPALVPQSANRMLSAAVLETVMLIAEHGLPGASARQTGILRGIQVHDGQLTDARLAADSTRPWQPYAG